MKFEKKASAVALVLVAILGLVFAYVLSENFTSPIDVDKSKKGEIASQVDVAMDRAITLGISDFLLNGFSDENKVWYCNYPYPPYLNETNRSIHDMVDRRVETYLETLRNEGYDISSPEISFDVDSLNEMELRNNSISVSVEDFFIGITQDDLEFKQNLDKSYDYDWPVWLMYNNILTWMEGNAGNLTNEIYENVFKEKPCQAITSSCDCHNDTMIPDSIKDNISLKEEDLYVALNNSLDKLNDKFAGTNIVCSYTLDKVHIENEPKIEYEYSLTSYLNESSDVIEWDESKYEYNYTHYLDDYSLPNPGSDPLGGCPTAIELNETWNESYGFNEVTVREKRIDFETGIKNTYDSDFESETCANSDLLIQKNELFAMDKKAGLLITYRCEDPTISIETDSGIGPLASEIKLRVAVELVCPLPTEEDITQAPAFVCGGGGGGGAVVTGTIMCDFPNSCSDCEQCVLDESSDTGYACLPEPEGVPCDTCTACDGNGACNQPIPAGFPDDCEGNCMVCDGENIGVAACAPAAGDLYIESNNQACDGTCLLCDQNAQCNRVPEDFGLVDSSFCGSCKTCGLDGDGSASCIANPEDDGEFVSGQECSMCLEGNIVPATDGAVDPSFCGTCEVCSGGACGYDPILSQQDFITKQCGSCTTCGLNDAGNAACIGDSTQNGNVCGNAGCSICTDGKCGGSPTTLGQLCRTDSSCETRCDANGKCSDGSATAGDSCSKNFAACITSGICSDKGKCIGGIPDGKQCCGSLICSSGDPCCPNGGGIGIWTCEACDDSTT